MKNWNNGFITPGVIHVRIQKIFSGGFQIPRRGLTEISTWQKLIIWQFQGWSVPRPPSGSAHVIQVFHMLSLYRSTYIATNGVSSFPVNIIYVLAEGLEIWDDKPTSECLGQHYDVLGNTPVNGGKLSLLKSIEKLQISMKSRLFLQNQNNIEHI